MMLRAVGIALVLTGAAELSSSLSFDELRAAGFLSNDFPADLMMCWMNVPRCKRLGHLDERNVIHWADDVTLDDLKAVIQADQDRMRLEINSRKGKQ